MDAVTIRQKAYIEAIEKELEIFGIAFTGTTKQEASAFIEKYAYYYRDMRRIERDLPPYWSMIANQPPRDPEIHRYFEEAAEYLQYEENAKNWAYDQYVLGY